MQAGLSAPPPALTSQLGGCRRNETARGAELNINYVADAQEENARILQAPFHIGHLEVCGSFPSIRCQLHHDRHGDFMLRTMNPEYPVDRHGGRSRRRGLSVDAVRPE